MRVDEWTFFDPLHPVYGRPPDGDHWLFGLPQFQPDKYRESDGGLVREPLHMDMLGHPSVELYRTPAGETIQKITLHSGYTPDIDLAEIRDLAEQWRERMEALSQGPYSLAALREMGHPYGYGERRDPYSWGRLRRPRAIPFMGSAGRIPGVRGRVSDRSVINWQTGRLAFSWYAKLLTWYGGVTLLVGNRAPYAWYLAHGSYKMQAHGPWGTVADQLLPTLMVAWRKAANAAWRRQRAAEAQFAPEETNAQTDEYAAGGWG